MDLRSQIAETSQTVLTELEKDPTSELALFCAALLVEFGASDPWLVLASKRFARNETTYERIREGAVPLLVGMWNGFGEAHHYGREVGVLADWLIALTTTAEELAQLPYAVGNFCGSWYEVGKPAARACDKIAATALERDPECESALWLYTNGDFLARVKRKGPPVSTPSIEHQIAKIERIVKLFEEDEVHPLDIPSLETIPVTSRAIVDALIHAIETTTSWRAKKRVIDALGRATVEIERVVLVLVDQLDDFADDVAMTIHYEMKDRGIHALEPLMTKTTELVACLDEANTSDYRHQWPLRAIVSLFQHTHDDRARAFLEALLALCKTMPAWKRERLFELENELPKILRRRR